MLAILKSFNIFAAENNIQALPTTIDAIRE